MKVYDYMINGVNSSHLHHGGDRVDPVQVLHQGLGQVCYTEADGPVSVSLQLDHFVGTKRR